MDKNIQATVYKILKDVLHVEISDDLTIDDVPSWDSLSHIQLLAKIDQAFDIEIDFEDTLSMTSVAIILTMVETYVAKK